MTTVFCFGQGDIQDLIYVPFAEGAEDVCTYYTPDCDQGFYTKEYHQNVNRTSGGSGGLGAAGSGEGSLGATGEVVMVDKSGMGLGAGGVVMVDKSGMGLGAGGVVMVDKSGMGGAGAGGSDMVMVDQSGGFLVDAQTGETIGKSEGALVLGKEGVPVSIYMQDCPLTAFILKHIYTFANQYVKALAIHQRFIQ